MKTNRKQVSNTNIKQRRAQSRHILNVRKESYFEIEDIIYNEDKQKCITMNLKYYITLKGITCINIWINYKISK